jgi:hypothetical protein
MASITNDLLKEAIADAERVRETAIANAKIQLEESIAVNRTSYQRRDYKSS